MMHFHVTCRCAFCGYARLLSTPIANIVILSSVCEVCGKGTYVGTLAGEWCDECWTQYCGHEPLPAVGMRDMFNGC